MTEHPDSYYSRPIVPLLAALIIGILLGSWAADYRIAGYAAAVMSGMVILYGRICLKPARILPLIFFAAAGYLSIQPWVTSQLPAHHISHFIPSASCNISGILDSSVSIENHRQKFDLKIESIQHENENNGQPFSVTGHIRVTVEGQPLDIDLGDRICFKARLGAIHNFHNPGGFDQKQYMVFNGIYGTAFVQSSAIKWTGSNHQTGFFQMIHHIRKMISIQIDGMDAGEEKEILKALVIGERTGIPERIIENFSKAGVSHLLVIAGLHVGIVATASFFIFQWILSRFSFFLWHAWTRKGAAILSIMPVWGYGLIAGMSPSTQRAVIMISIFLMTFLIHRNHESLNTLAVAAMIMLMVHPSALFSISFQMSFSSVFSILYILPKFWQPVNGNQNPGLRFRNFLLSSLWVTLSATLGTLLPVMYYFNQLSLIGIISNFILVPIVGFGAVPLGLLSAGVSLTVPAVGMWGLKISAMVLAFSLGLTNFLAELPFSSIRTITPSILEMICAYTLLFALITLKEAPVPDFQSLQSLYFRNRTKLSSSTQTILRILSVASVIILGIDALYWGYHRFFRSDFRVTALDVGQGTANLLELPKGFVMLIDAGGFSDNSVFDVGKMIIAPLLWQKKIRTVDTLVLSHADSDHINGMLYIAEYFHVKNAWINADLEDRPHYHKLIEILAHHNVFPVDFRIFPRHHEINGVIMDIVNPPSDVMEKAAMDAWRNVNNDSIAVHASFGKISMLFPGDIQSPAEKEMVSLYGENLRSQILIAPHHGSKTSSSTAFVETIKPELVIFSTGLNNRFKFPHPSVVKRYQNLGAALLNTAVDGAIMIRTDGDITDIRPMIGRTNISFSASNVKTEK